METPQEDSVAAHFPEGLIDAVFEYGVDLIGRRIFLHENVTEGSVGLAIRGLYFLDSMANRKIELFVASYGGLLDDAFALYDAMSQCRSEIHTVAIGKCQSAAPLILLGGDVRWAGPNCQFMLHDVSLDGSDEPMMPDQLEAHTKAAKASMDNYAALLGERTNREKAFWKRKFAKRADSFFTAEEAQEWGIVHHLWSEK